MSDLSKISEDYQKVRPQYKNFTQSLHNLLRTILDASEIDYFAIEPRTKETKSFDEKINREDKSGKYKTFSDVADLSGIRIIAYLKEDCDKICQIIEDNFEIDRPNSSVKEEELDPDKFGYLSTHFVISLTAERLGLIEFSPFKDFKAEIQIRTLLQHTWAAIDWKFRYKEKKEAPKVLRRRLYRISALLEAADNEFSAVKERLDTLRKEYSEGIVRGNLAISLNIESARSFIRESSTAKSVLSEAEKAGIIVNRSINNEMISRLVGASEILRIKTLDSLDDHLQRFLPDAPKFFGFMAEEARKVRPDKSPMLVAPAIIRYAIMRFATSVQRKQINATYKPSPGYAEGVTAFFAAENE
jgi:putative GTP pyrophosphokinase